MNNSNTYNTLHSPLAPVAAIITALTMATTGCAASSMPAAQDSLSQGEYSDLASGDIAGARVPADPPTVIPGLAGYCLKDEKKFIVNIEDAELPGEISIVEDASKKTVYTAPIQADKKSRDGYMVLNFSDFDKAGRFYIDMGDVGISRVFPVGKDIYEDIYKDCTEKALDMAGEGTALQLAGRLYRELLSLEFYPEEDAITSLTTGEIPVGDTSLYSAGAGRELSQIAGKECEALIKAVDSLEVADGISRNVSDMYREAAALAKYAHVTEDKDEKTVSAAMDAAIRLYGAAASPNDEPFVSGGDDVKDGTEKVDAVKYETALSQALAAMELYRAGGKQGYLDAAQAVIEEIMESDRELTTDEFLLFTSYLNAAGDVDVELCGRLMDRIKKNVEEIVRQSKAETFLIRDKESLFDDGLRICIVDYAIKNHEYDTVVGNHVHYLTGRNAGSEMLWQDLADELPSLLMMLRCIK